MKSGAASNPACRTIADVLLDIHAGWRCESANLVVSVVRFSSSFFFYFYFLFLFFYLLVFTGDCLFRIRFSLLLAL